MRSPSSTSSQHSGQARPEAIARLTRHPVIPVIVIEDENDAEPLAEALLAGGLDLIEVTLRTAAAVGALGRIIRRFPEMLAGAGTVVTPEQAKKCLDLGVSFGVAPGFNPETVRLFEASGVPFMPGVLSPSEIESAYAHGCTLLKFFPAEAAGGTKMLRALAGPYGPLGIRFCPTGGVSLDNMKEYLSLPSVFAVGGSWLASQRQIAEKQWSVITQQTREALSRAREVSPMSRLIHERFLLQSEEAVRLYHDYAAGLPIIDYHTHLPPAEVAADRRWQNISQVWLNGDHYKWRQMRTNGIAERFCTGDATDREKFDAFAGIVPYLLRNPLYHWCHLELARYFQIDDLLLSERTADEIWERSSAVLRSGLSARSLIEKSNVVAVCTSDDPIDTLEHHAAVAADATFAARMLPTWRPGRLLAVADSAAWNGYVDELAAVANVEIASFDDLVTALTGRRDVFHEAGCRLSDHALAAGVFSPASSTEIRAAFDRLRSGTVLPASERDQLTTALLLELGRLYREKGWTLQLRIGAMRDNNSAMFAALGPDTGYDSMGDRSYAEPLAQLLNALHSAGNLPRTILYNVNPRDTEMLASMLGCFEDGSVPGKMQLGAAWWFLDQKDGIERQLEAISQMGSLRRFVGMVADSRSFLSFSRHEYFRRILCNVLGADMAAGLLPRDFDLVGALVEDVCFRNAESYFGFELRGRQRETASASASPLHAAARS